MSVLPLPARGPAPDGEAVSGVRETPDERGQRLLRIALQVAVRLREEPADAADRELDGLDPAEIRHLALVACGGLDVDRPISELYGWVGVERVPRRVPRSHRPDGSLVEPCGTRPAYRRHLAHGQPPDVACELAAQDYEAGRWAAGETRRSWPRKGEEEGEAAEVASPTPVGVA